MNIKVGSKVVASGISPEAIDANRTGVIESIIKLENTGQTIVRVKFDEPYTMGRGLITSADFEPSELELIESATQSGNAEFAVVMIIIVALLGFLFLFLATQHGKSSVVQPTPTPRSVSSGTPVGTWVDRNDERAIEFNKDGTFLAIAPSGPVEGKWKIKGEKICLFEFTIETDVEICHAYKQNGDVMIYGSVTYDRTRK